MLRFLSKIFGGDKSAKDITRLVPIVKQINTFQSECHALDNDTLRQKTKVFRESLVEHLSGVNEAMDNIKQQIQTLSDGDILRKDELYNQIDALEKDKLNQTEDFLKSILPEAFAVIKETARRFTENEKIVSKPTPLDHELAEQKNYISIQEESVEYDTTWTAGGGDIKWNMVHYDVQLIGGMCLHQGKISEMSTGEGKTLVSTLPAYLNAIAGQGVHVITVNNYLSVRDSEWNAPIFEWLGLKVDCIDKYRPNSAGRRNAYLADITYGTNNEFGFDYLRDNMVFSAKEAVQRKHHYAIIDEVDSVLIDEARTPLIISGPVTKDNTHKRFEELKPLIARLYEKQKLLVSELLQAAKKNFAEKNISPKEGGLSLYRAYRALPKYNPLIKFLSGPGVKVELQKIENFYLSNNQKEMPLVDKELFFHIEEKSNSVDLTDKGLAFLAQQVSEDDFFILPELSIELEQLEKQDIDPKEKLIQKEEIINDYSVKSERIHAVQQLLKSYALFHKDVEYVVVNGEVKIVDEQTGRIMEGRRYSDGLHQAIEAKENVKIEGASQTYATITLQNYFRMYHKLSGMTGTAITEAGEFWQIYKLDVVTIPTHLPCVRDDHNDKVYKTKREKYKAVIEEIQKMTARGRAVLVGTTSVEVSELISRMLKQQSIKHNVLNAKQHQKEAVIVAEAGLPKAVTIATNMAGRGTDIKLDPQVKEAGGLAILGTERHDSRRVDRQLRGRSGRQGDPGSSQFFVTLEDDLMRMFGSQRIASLMDKMGYKEGEVIQHSLITRSIQRAQKKVEENNFGIRKRLLEYDDIVNKQRNTIYQKRNHALHGEKLEVDIDNAFYFLAQQLVSDYVNTGQSEELQFQSLLLFGIEPQLSKNDLAKKDSNVLTELLYQQIIQHYSQKKQSLKELTLPLFQEYEKLLKDKDKQLVLPLTNKQKIISIPIMIKENLDSNGDNFISNLERFVTLSIIDEHWKEHLRLIDELKQNVQGAVYEQKDPLVIYKVEAFKLFTKLNYEINKGIVSFLNHCYLVSRINPERNTEEPRPFDFKDMNLIKRDVSHATQQQNNNSSGAEEKQAPIVKETKIGRNDPCPCGSGKKYKNCHLKIEV